MNNYDFYGGQYDYAFEEARRLERKSLSKNALTLGLLLIIYNIFQNVGVYVYYFVFYFVKAKAFTLNLDTVISFIRDNLDSISETEFEMFGNAFVTLFALVILLIAAKLVFKIGVFGLVRTDSKGLSVGVKAFPFSMLLNFIFTLATSMVSAVFKAGGIVIPEAEFTVDKPTFLAGFSMFAYMVVLAPIIEELVYRGFILKLLQPYGKTMAVFFSAFIFGFMHGNFSQFVTAFATGIVYAAVAVYSNSIAPTILMHMLNNGLNFIAICGEDYGVDALLTVYSVLFVVILLLGIMEIFLFRNVIKKRPSDACVLTLKERVKTVVFNPAMIIYFLYLLYSFVAQIIRANLK